MIPLPTLSHNILWLHSLTYVWNLLWNQEEKRGFRETNIKIKMTVPAHQCMWLSHNKVRRPPLPTFFLSLQLYIQIWQVCFPSFGGPGRGKRVIVWNRCVDNRALSLFLTPWATKAPVPRLPNHWDLGLSRAEGSCPDSSVGSRSLGGYWGKPESPWWASVIEEMSKYNPSCIYEGRGGCVMKSR